MQWQGISEFTIVAETESFTKTAQILNISIAQVSRQINALEKRLNVKLFYRTTRKVSLTEEGNVFYQHCRHILDALTTAEKTITHLQKTPQGNIKLTAPVTYGETKILPLINDFIKKYQAINVNAYLSNRPIDIVKEGYDLAIRIGKLPNSSMMAKKLGTRKNYICASRDYLAHYGIPHSLAELSQHNCLIGSLDCWRFQENDIEKNIRIKGNIRYNSGKSLADAALKGLGLVQLPDYYVEDYIHEGLLVPVLEQFIKIDGIWAVYPHNRQLPPKIKVLLKHLTDNLQTSLEC